MKIICGRFPTTELLQKYKLYEYVDIALSVYKGDLKEFKNQVNSFKRLWIKRGLYLIMEQLQLVLMRNLFKKIFLMTTKKFNKFQIDTEYYLKALNWNSDESFEMDEVECLIANLIFKHYIKGYLSHEKRKVVFSKENAFPNIIDVVKKQEAN